MTDYFGEDANKRIISAVEKRIIAKQKKNEFEQLSSSKMAIAIVLILSFILALLMTNGVLAEGLPYQMGSALDIYLFGPGNPTFSGNAIVDTAIAVLVRGLIIFVVAGIIPGITLGWQTLLNKTHLNGYVAVWGTMVGFAIIIYLLKDKIAGLFI